VLNKVGGRSSQATADHTQVSVAFTRGTGSMFLRWRASADGPIRGEWRWTTESVSGKTYNMSSVFYNNPQHWDWP
jgi:hypothetical protein